MNNVTDISIVILCYKEGNAVYDFIKKTTEVLFENNISNYELILVGNYDSGKDITPSVVKKIASNDSRIKFIAQEKKGMMGWDLKCGLGMAQGNYIAYIDGDGQMPISDIVKVYHRIQSTHADLVKTYRINRGDNLLRKLISYLFNFLFVILFPGLKSKDINSKPKILTRKAYQKLNLKSDDWFIDAEIMIQARRHHFSINEIPTVFYETKGRKSFINVRAIFEFLKNLILYRIKEFKYLI